MLLILDEIVSVGVSRLTNYHLCQQLYTLLDCWNLGHTGVGVNSFTPRRPFHYPLLTERQLNQFSYFSLREWESRGLSQHPLSVAGFVSATRGDLTGSRMDSDLDDFITCHRGHAKYLGELDKLKRRVRILIGKGVSINVWCAGHGVAMSRGISPDQFARLSAELDRHNVPKGDNWYDKFAWSAPFTNRYYGPGM